MMTRTWVVLQCSLSVCRLDLVCSCVFRKTQDSIRLNGRRFFIFKGLSTRGHVDSCSGESAGRDLLYCWLTLVRCSKLVVRRRDPTRLDLRARKEVFMTRGCEVGRILYSDE